MGECLLHLILLATFEVTVLGTDLPLLCQATGSEEWEVSLLNLCVSTTPSASIHLSAQWHVNTCGKKSPLQSTLLPAAPFPASGLPSWLSLAAKLSSKG